MPLNYSTGSSKPGVSSLYYSNGTTKSPLASLHYSDGTNKLPVWTSGGLGPISKYDYVLTGSTSARINNGQVQWWLSSLLQSPVGNFSPGDWSGFNARDYWGNLYGNSYNTGDDRYYYLEMMIWNPQTNTFNRMSTQDISTPYYVDPVTQHISKYVAGTSTSSGSGTSYLRYMDFQVNSVDPATNRTYIPTSDKFIQTSIRGILPIRAVANGGPRTLRPRDSVVVLSNEASKRFDVYYINRISINNPEQYIGSIPFEINDTSELCYMRNIIPPNNYWSSKYVLAIYTPKSTGTITSSAKITFYELSNEFEYINSHGYIGDFIPQRDVGFTNDFSEYILEGYIPLSNGTQLERYLFYNVNTYTATIKDKIKNGAIIIPQRSTSKNIEEVVFTATNKSGSTPNYYMDVKIDKYLNGSLIDTRTDLQLHFSSNSPSWWCSSPHYNYFKNNPL